MCAILNGTEPSEKEKTMNFFASRLLIKMQKVAPDATTEDALALLKRIVEFYAVATPIPNPKQKP